MENQKTRGKTWLIEWPTAQGQMLADGLLSVLPSFKNSWAIIFSPQHILFFFLGGGRMQVKKEGMEQLLSSKADWPTDRRTNELSLQMLSRGRAIQRNILANIRTKSGCYIIVIIVIMIIVIVMVIIMVIIIVIVIVIVIIMVVIIVIVLVSAWYDEIWGASRQGRLRVQCTLRVLLCVTTCTYVCPTVHIACPCPPVRAAVCA